MRPALRRQRGLSLVEILVAIALATIIVGVVAASSVQVQNAIGIAQSRLVEAAEVRAMFVEIEQDLARMIPGDAPLAPFTYAQQAGFTGIVPPPTFPAGSGATVQVTHPIMLERTGAATGIARQTNDPPDLVRYGDQIRVFSTVYDPLNQRPARSLVEYSLDWSATGTTGAVGGTGQQPNYYQLPGNGLYVGRLRRRVLQQAAIATDAQLDTVGGTAQGTPGALPPLSPILVDRVVSFQVEWVDAKASDLASSASVGGRSADVYLPPDNKTKDGSAFVLAGQVVVNSDADAHVNGVAAGPSTTDQTLDPLDPSAGSPDVALLTAIPVGGEIILFNSDFNRQGTTSPYPLLPNRYLVRHRHKAGTAAAPYVDRVFVNDRVFVERDPPLPPAGQTGWKRVVQARAFYPPAVLRVTVVLSFGKGPDSGTARFSRLIPVSR